MANDMYKLVAKTLHNDKLVELQPKVLHGGKFVDLELETYLPFVPLWTAVPTKLSLNGVIHEGQAYEVPELHRVIHTVELSGLTPDTVYDFNIPDDPEVVYTTFKDNPSTNMVVHWQTKTPFLNFNKEPDPRYSYKFKTLPATLDNKSVTMISGGDIYIPEPGNFEKMQAVFETVASRRPDIFVICGDIAYANNTWSRRSQWHEFWEEWMRCVDPTQPLIPMIAGIGNHEIGDGARVTGYHGTRFDFENQELGHNTWFAAQFAFPQNGAYGVVDIGDYLSIIMTDTEHASPEITGTDDQSVWLQNTLDARANVKHVIPFHHVPAYPSARNYWGPQSRNVREQWTPLYESHGGIKVVFEHHDHTYKRTVPILHVDGMPTEHPDGIRYLGDGAMGVAIRDGWNPHTTWYLEDVIVSTYVKSQQTQEDHPLDGQPGYDQNVDEAWHVYETTFESDKRTITSWNIWDETAYHVLVQEVGHV